MRVLSVFLFLSMLVFAATPLLAVDANFGAYARSEAMGGAGLALIDSSTSASGLNPAAAAANGGGLKFVIPSVDYSCRGASLSDLADSSSEINSSNEDDAIKLAEDFGERQTILTVGATTGFVGRFGITAEGEAQGLINPGSNFSAWVAAGHPTDAATLQSLGFISGPADLANFANNLTTNTSVIGRYVYAAPAVYYATAFNTSKGKLWAGTKVRFLHSEVRSWNIAAGESGGNVSLSAAEAEQLKDNGVGADIGFVFRPTKSRMQYGMAISNFLEPKLSGISAPAMLSVGAAAQFKPGILAAIDLVNINQAYSEKTRLRMGAEWKIGRLLALRGGYSGTSFTWGFGAFGLDFAFSDKAPNIISRSLWF